VQVLQEVVASALYDGSAWSLLQQAIERELHKALADVATPSSAQAQVGNPRTLLSDGSHKIQRLQEADGVPKVSSYRDVA
jgi:hypothetical protein